MLEKNYITIVNNAKQSFIASIDQNGYPNLKAMLPPRRIENDKVFFFTTNTSSMRVKQYRENPKASIYFFSPRFFKGVMLTGTMEVLDDDYHKELIWQEGDNLYYPKGVTDPDYCVLKFTAKDYRYYENFSSQTFVL